MASKSAKKSKELNLNQLYLAPLIVQIGLAALIAAAILGLAYFVLFSDQLNELHSKQDEESKLKETYTAKAVQAAQLPVLKQELAQLESAFQILLKQLPTNAEVPNLLQELHAAGANNGMRMDSLVPGAKRVDGPIQVLPYNISVTGSYAQLSTFAKDVGQLSRIVVLDNARLSTTGKGQIVMTANANTYIANDAVPTASAPKAAAASTPASAPK